MKRQDSQDERVVAQRRKIQSEGFAIVFFLLLLSWVVQSLFLNAPWEQYAVEMICFLGMSLYLLIRSVTLGHSVFGDSKRAKAMPVVNSLVIGVIATVIVGVLNAARYSEHYENNAGFYIAELAVFFVSLTVTAFVGFSFLQYLHKKKQAKIQKQLDDSERDE